MVNNKIKSLLALCGETMASYARQLNMYPQSLAKKSQRLNYTISDLIYLGELTNNKLAFIDENNQPIIIFNKSDLKPKE